MEIQFFHSRFKRVTRSEREQILCAMIRVNYGTPWEGDGERLKNFFPEEFHNKLVFGGLTELVEALNPFADEPTDYSVNHEEHTLKEGEKTFNRGILEITSSLSEVTTDLPQGFEKTVTSKIPAHS